MIVGSSAGNTQDQLSSGEELEKLAKEVIAQPRDIIERMKGLLGD